MAIRIEDVLEKEGVYVSTTSGVSMYPLLRDRRDTIIVSPCTGKLKKYDVPLYRRGDAYILHRIIEVHPDSYVILGDNCIQKEYDIKQEQIIGVLTGIYRGDKEINMNGLGYKMYVHVWCALYPARYLFKKCKAFAGRVLRKLKGRQGASVSVSSNEETDDQKAGLYLMQLIRAALRDEKAVEKPEDVSWELVYKAARDHNVDGLSSYGAMTLQKKPPQEIWSKWKDAAQRTMFRILQFDVEREVILKEFDNAGIDYIPLKGVQIAGYYPKPGMRTMVDNDILYRSLDTDKMDMAKDSVRDIMLKRGYKIYCPNDVDDAYHKLPFFNFEMHKMLVHKNSEFYGYYENPWNRALKDEDNVGGYHFSNEDEFIYFLVHAYKHFSAGGCGIRMLTDLQVFLDAKEEMMDFAYIKKELDKLETRQFYEESAKLAKKLFSSDREELTGAERDRLFFLLGCGTYGTLDNNVENQLSKIKSKNPRKVYLWSRIFPDNEWWREWCPMGYNRPYLWPLLSVYRIVKGVVLHPKKLIREIKILLKKR